MEIKLAVLVIISIAVSSSSINSMNKLTDITYIPRGLLIFLDDSETEIDAVSNDLITALAQNAGPIIVSASLLVNVFSKDTGQFKYEDPKDLVKKFEGLQFAVDKEEAIIAKKYILLRALAFDPNSWIIKKISDSMYLFIPHYYLKSLHIRIDPTKLINDRKEVSEVELQLGLKVNHMETVDFDNIINRHVIEHTSADYFVNELYNARTKTSSIFCTNSEYYENEFFNYPLWSIYMSGHGELRSLIVGLNLEDFKLLLDFLENKINCRLLMYTSCYAAGLNNETIFKDAQSAIEKTYSFPIITQVLTESPAAAIELRVELAGRGNLKLETFKNFKDFLKEVTKSEVTDYEKVVTSISPILPRQELREFKWSNVPQIKFPGVEWFSVMASRKDIVVLGSILSKTRDSERPLTLVKFFKTNPKAILLYAQDIPFELVIDSVNLEAIVSMIPGDAIHRIKRISSSQKNINSILNWFMAIKMLDPRKIFYIKEINDIKDVIIYNKKIPMNKRFNIPAIYECYAFYSDHGIVYMKESDGRAQIVSEDKRKLYQDLLIEVKGEIKKLGAYTFKTQNFMRFPPINSPTIIQKIESEKNDIPLWAIINEIELNLSQNAVAWVNQMSGLYDKGTFNIPGVTPNEFITITDVVIDRKRNIFFTYNNEFYHGKNKINEDYREDYKKRMSSTPQSNKFSVLTADSVNEINRMLAMKIKKGPMKRIIEKPVKNVCSLQNNDIIVSLQQLEHTLKSLYRVLKIS